MKILTHNIHTGYDAELSKTGHEFFVLDDVMTWNPALRQRPPNWRQVKSHLGLKVDCVLITQAWDLFGVLKDVDVPFIFSILADCSEGVFPRHIEERCAAVTFLSREVSERWALSTPSKKVIVEMGIDETPFLEHKGDTPIVLTVGSSIGKRWDKGHCQYVTVYKFIPLTLVGPENEELPGAVGVLTQESLMKLYSRSQVYFNPGPVIGISVAEAMFAGLPIVTFRSINLTHVIVDGINGFVVDTVDGAVLKINTLLRDPALASQMGLEARKTAREVFGADRFTRQWNALFRKVGGPA